MIVASSQLLALVYCRSLPSLPSRFATKTLARMARIVGEIELEQWQLCESEAAK